MPHLKMIDEADLFYGIDGFFRFLLFEVFIIFWKFSETLAYWWGYFFTPYILQAEIWDKYAYRIIKRTKHYLYDHPEYMEEMRKRCKEKFGKK